MRIKTYILLICIISIVSLSSCGGKATDKDLESQKFPSFSTSSLDGKTFNEEVFRQNQVTVVNFWYSECPSCIGELGDLQKLNEAVKEKGGNLISFNTDLGIDEEKNLTGNFYDVEEIMRSAGANYPVLAVPKESELSTFVKGISAYPVTYVVNNEGEIIGEPLFGGIDNPTVKEMLDEKIAKALESKQK